MQDPAGVFLDTQPSGYLPLTPVATVQHFQWASPEYTGRQQL